MGAAEKLAREATEATIRHAVPDADGPRLVELTRLCPMEGDVALRIDRAPDFFALSKCRGDGYTLVAETDSHIVGCISVARRPAYVAGERTSAGYVGDVKVHPAHRRSGLAKRLLAEVERIEALAPPAFYAGTTAAGNSAVDGLLLRFGQNHPVPRIGSFVSYQLLPVFRAGARDGRTAIGVARDDDEGELAELLDDAHRRYTFGPVFRDGGLREILARSPGMSIADYLVARRGGRIVAAVGIWDQHAIKQTHVLRMTRSLRWLSAAMRAGAPLGLPRLPREGEALTFRYARHAAGEPAVVASLLRHALETSRERKEHFLLFTCSEGDPLAKSVAGMARTTYRYGLVAGKNKAYDEGELKALASSLPFDDAALA